jgi:lipid A 3-O-deacylase
LLNEQPSFKVSAHYNNMPSTPGAKNENRKVINMQLRRPIQLSSCLAFALFSATSTLATAEPFNPVPAVQVLAGRDAGKDIDKTELTLVWDTGWKWGNPQGWLLNLDLELALAHWNAKGGTNSRNLFEAGISPMFRVEYRGWRVVPYLEGGIGVRGLSRTKTSDEHRYSTAFQFADTIGVGISMGDRQQFSVGYRYQHISNANIKRPNPGVDFNEVYLRYRF